MFGQSVRSAVVSSVLANNGALLITFGLMVVAARMLPPAELGIFVVAFAAVLVLDTMRDMSLGAFIIQTPQPQLTLLRSVLGLSILLSLGVAVALFALSEYLAALLGSTTIAPLLRIMALAFALSPFQTPAVAMLQREMRFNSLLYFRLGSAGGRATVSIALLISGAGASALAWGFVASRVAEFLILACVRAPHTFIVPSFRNMGSALSYGWRATGALMLGAFGASIADLATGRFLGVQAAAIYNRGASLLQLYRNGIELALFPVVLASFAELQRKSGESGARAAYLYSLKILSVLGWPAFALLAVLAEPILYLLFGGPWLPATSTTQILALGGMIYLLSSLTPRVLMALGCVNLLLKRELFIQLPRVVLVLGAAQVSIEAVAWAIVGTYALSFVVNQSVLKAATGVRLLDVARACGRSIIVAFVTGLTAAGASYYSRPLGYFPEVLITCLLAGLVWLSAVYLVGHAVRSEIGRACMSLTRPRRKLPRDDAAPEQSNI